MLICWNVNSINTRLSHVVSVINKFSPEILLFQETKCIDKNFPSSALEDLGYNIALSGQKSYNGVAIMSKKPLEDIAIGLPGLDNAEARYIEASVMIAGRYTRVISVYVPNGADVESEKFTYKKQFLDLLQQRLIELKKTEENIIIAGDFNVAPDDIDVYDAKKMSGHLCFHIEERTRFRKLINCGFIDSFRSFNNTLQTFSWWDYRAGGWQNNKGLRIDHILVSPAMADVLQKAEILTEPRGWQKPSDHAPISVSW
jgi:exodeoxyribonuclease-3